MTYLLAGLLIFFGVHSVSIVAPSWRNAAAAKLGEYPWKGLYSLLALGGFLLMVTGYGQMRAAPVLLYAAPSWTRHLAVLLMLPAFPLLLSTYLPGRIQRAARHPMLVATMLWSAAHVLVNGALGDVLVFGSFLAWALLDRLSLAHRPARALPTAPASKANDAVAVVLGLLLYAAFVKWLHLRWFGVSPL